MPLKYKICGINNKENLKEILLLKPNFIGHIFYPKSPRDTSNEALTSFHDVDYGHSSKVAVMVNPTVEYIHNLYEDENFRFVQLHGEETATFCQELKNKCTELKILKAFGIDENWKQEVLRPFLNCVDYFVFDTKTEKYGGSGLSFNWELLKDYKFDIPYLLSGGLNPNNLEQARVFATSQPKCYGLDLNSGYELSPGLKSVELLKEIL